MESVCVCRWLQCRHVRHASGMSGDSHGCLCRADMDNRNSRDMCWTWPAGPQELSAIDIDWVGTYVRCGVVLLKHTPCDAVCLQSAVHVINATFCQGSLAREAVSRFGKCGSVTTRNKFWSFQHDRLLCGEDTTALHSRVRIRVFAVPAGTVRTAGLGSCPFSIPCW